MWKLSATLALVLVPYELARAGNVAEQMLMASHECVAVQSVEIRQTVEQTARVFIDGKPKGGLQTTKQTSTIEIDSKKGLVRMTTKDASSKDLVVLRKGKHIAMRIGSEPWCPPKGMYARIGDQLGNPFACPLPKPGGKRSPRWTMVGAEQLDGTDTTMIETIGDTANNYAAERMREGLKSMFADAKTQPAIDVLAYKSRHWIRTKDGRRLRVEQTSHLRMTMPGAGSMVIDTSGKTVAVYSRYGQVEIQVPDEARRILEPSR